MTSCAPSSASTPSSPYFLQVTRWKAFLLLHSSAYRALKEERERGWNSASLDQWYANRGYGKSHEGTSDASPSTSSPVFQSHFSESSTEQLASRYCEHVHRTWGKYVRERDTRKERDPSHTLPFVGIASRTTSLGRTPQDAHDTVDTIIGGKRKRVEGERISTSVNDTTGLPSITHDKGVPLLAPLQRGREGIVYGFLDLGCAPGGASSFFCHHLHWSGVGVTLRQEDGGIPVWDALQCLYEESWPLSQNTTASIQYLLWDGDVTRQEDTWTLRSSPSRLLPHVSHADISIDTNDAPKTERPSNPEDPRSGTLVIGETKDAKSRSRFDVFSSLFGAHSFSFIHAGAVQDYGQRREHFTSPLLSSSGSSPPEKESDGEDGRRGVRAKKEEASTTKSPEIDNVVDNGHSSSLTSASLQKSLCPPLSESETTEIVPWFTLLRPQLRLALQYVAPGGSIVLVYGAPHCASFFIFLHGLRLSLGKGLRIRLFETMHLSKAPVYVFLENVNATTPSVPFAEKKDNRKWEDENHRRQMALLQAMDPSSPVVCPYFLSGSSVKANDPGSPLETESTLQQAKQNFWLGESEEGMAAATAGYTFFCREIERIWDRARVYLERRRHRAENVLHTEK